MLVGCCMFCQWWPLTFQVLRAALMAGVDPSIGATAAAGLQGVSGGLIGELPVTTGAPPMGQPMGETATLAVAGSGLAAPGSAPGYLAAAATGPPPLASSPVISPHTGAQPGLVWRWGARACTSGGGSC